MTQMKMFHEKEENFISLFISLSLMIESKDTSIVFVHTIKGFD
jgi:hypothetical protein